MRINLLQPIFIRRKLVLKNNRQKIISNDRKQMTSAQESRFSKLYLSCLLFLNLFLLNVSKQIKWIRTPFKGKKNHSPKSKYIYVMRKCIYLKLVANSCYAFSSHVIKKFKFTITPNKTTHTSTRNTNGMICVVAVVQTKPLLQHEEH